MTKERMHSDIISKLYKKFGQQSQLETAHGMILEYLGMTIDYTNTGKVKISMYEYTKTMYSEFPSDINGVLKTPAAGHLVNVNENASKLDDDKSQRFYHLVARLLYLSHRSRQDIQTAVESYVPGYRRQIKSPRNRTRSKT